MKHDNAIKTENEFQIGRSIARRINLKLHLSIKTPFANYEQVNYEFKCKNYPIKHWYTTN